MISYLYVLLLIWHSSNSSQVEHFFAAGVDHVNS